MIRSILIVAFLSLSACDPVDYVTDQAADKCEAVLEERLPEVRAEAWEICTSFYEEIIIPGLQGEIDGLIGQIDDLLEQREDEIMLYLGCVRDDSVFGWDCSSATICYGD